MRGFKSIFVSSKHKINCFLIQEKYFQTANAVDTLPLKSFTSEVKVRRKVRGKCLWIVGRRYRAINSSVLNLLECFLITGNASIRVSCLS